MSDLEKSISLLLKGDLEKQKKVPITKINITEQIIQGIVVYIDNISAAIKQFPSAYQHNNIYALFRLSEEFYINSIEFINLSHHLLKNKFINVSEDDKDEIFECMVELKSYIEALETDRDIWIKESTIMIEPDFLGAVCHGDEKLTVLKSKIQGFINDSLLISIEESNKIQRSQTTKLRS